ncbi:DNA-3-methyladenine glycosylase [Octadecabacter sp. 1_MG-2023]|uniref:DNA-3-methyladenine glycosylase family protein n=1 Tax=unclassified Octadecabacter TaxID=196158 RepID=UPI001C08FD01|nr:MULTISPECIES: DNA-3-methyladenine glycosylase [unclassified Octadecabacter]MBU2993400.1 DNA-3-methyladenine glycosylase [Octadecabacter sp. B2R22]MDO6733144.1 DNA-3-methyladenine glycosylase [Octadecabacter sp. 1_MG-2023]
MTERIIHTDADVEEGMEALSALCPRMKAAYAETGPLPLRRKPDGFDQLLNAIIGQQVSIASAAAIWGRMEGAGMTTVTACASASEDELRGLGLSRQKALYAGELARAGIDFDGLREMPSDAVIKTLTAVKGIGPWTAEVYAMFSLGRADVFAPGDLALQEAAKVLYDLPERPKERAFREMAKDWAPWRSVAARLLWAYYRVAKKREGIR